MASQPPEDSDFVLQRANGKPFLTFGMSKETLMIKGASGSWVFLADRIDAAELRDWLTWKLEQGTCAGRTQPKKHGKPTPSNTRRQSAKAGFAHDAK